MVRYFYILRSICSTSKLILNPYSESAKSSLKKEQSEAARMLEDIRLQISQRSFPPVAVHAISAGRPSLILAEIEVYGQRYRNQTDPQLIDRASGIALKRF